MATHSSIPAWRISWTEEPGSPWGCKELDMTEQLTLSLSQGDKSREKEAVGSLVSCP